MELIKKIESENLRKENFDFNVGDTVRVSYRIKEGDKTRLQDFEGTVIAIRGKPTFCLTILAKSPETRAPIKAAKAGAI